MTGDKVGAVKDSVDAKKRGAEAAQQRYQMTRDRAEAAKKFQETKDLEYLRGKNDASDRIMAAKDRASQASGSVDQRKVELAQAQDLVRKIIEKIEKGVKK